MDSRSGEEPDYAQVYGKGQVTVNRTLLPVGAVRDRNPKVGNRAGQICLSGA
jgi:hypothetical protein